MDQMRQHLNKYAEHSRVHEQPGYLYSSMVTCARKKRHHTITQAEAERVEMQSEYPRNVYHTYYCTFCHGYHVGKLNSKGG